MAFMVERLDSWCVTGYPGFVESSGKNSQAGSLSFSISVTMCFWSACKVEVLNVVEVLTD